MSYIGIDPNVGDITFQKFTGTGSATAFTLSQAVVSGEAIVVTIGNVVQEPGSSAAYTAQANTLTFSAAPANGDIITVRYFGRAVDQPTSYAMQLFKYVATASQTAFTGADANGAILVISGNDVDVYLNGVHLDSSDFTASGGDTITLGTGAALNDELVIRAYRAFSVTDTVSKASGGTFAGGVTMGSALTATAGASSNAVSLQSANFKVTDLTANAFYRTGPFVPAYSSTAATDVESSIFGNYVHQHGFYTRIGNLVYAQGDIKLQSGSSVINGGASNQALTIAGLPFSIKNTPFQYPSINVGYFADWIGWGASFTPMGYGNIGTKTITLTLANTNGTLGAAVSYIYNPDARIVFDLTYETDDA